MPVAKTPMGSSPYLGVFACCGVLSSRVRGVGGIFGLFQGCSGVFSVVGRR